MFSAMLLAISIVALSQFALYYWRAVLAGVASQPVSERVLVAAQVENGRLTPEHFRTLAGLHELTPDLQPNRSGLRLVRLYYRVIEGLDAFLGQRIPTSSSGQSRPRGFAAFLLIRFLKSLHKFLVRPAQQHTPSGIAGTYGDN